MALKHVQYTDETHQLIYLNVLTGEEVESEVESYAMPIVFEIFGQVFIAVSDFYEEAEGVYAMKLKPHRTHEGETLYLFDIQEA